MQADFYRGYRVYRGDLYAQIEIYPPTPWYLLYIWFGGLKIKLTYEMNR